MACEWVDAWMKLHEEIVADKKRISDLEAYIAATPLILMDLQGASPQVLIYSKDLLEWRERGKALGVVKD